MTVGAECTHSLATAKAAHYADCGGSFRWPIEAELLKAVYEGRRFEDGKSITRAIGWKAA